MDTNSRKPQKIQIAVDEPVSFVVDKIKRSFARYIVLVVPEKAGIVSSIPSLKILARELSKLDKIIILLTRDVKAISFANSLNISTAMNYDEITPEIWELAENNLIEHRTEYANRRQKLIDSRKVQEVHINIDPVIALNSSHFLKDSEGSVSSKDIHIEETHTENTAPLKVSRKSDFEQNFKRVQSPSQNDSRVDNFDIEDFDTDKLTQIPTLSNSFDIEETDLKDDYNLGESFVSEKLEDLDDNSNVDDSEYVVHFRKHRDFESKDSAPSNKPVYHKDIPVVDQDSKLKAQNILFHTEKQVFQSNQPQRKETEYIAQQEVYTPNQTFEELYNIRKNNVSGSHVRDISRSDDIPENPTIKRMNSKLVQQDGFIIASGGDLDEYAEFNDRTQRNNKAYANREYGSKDNTILHDDFEDTEARDRLYPSANNYAFSKNNNVVNSQSKIPQDRKHAKSEHSKLQNMDFESEDLNRREVENEYEDSEFEQYAESAKKQSNYTSTDYSKRIRQTLSQVSSNISDNTKNLVGNISKRYNDFVEILKQKKSNLNNASVQRTVRTDYSRVRDIPNLNNKPNNNNDMKSSYTPRKKKLN